jgi:hypothetical protein
MITVVIVSLLLGLMVQEYRASEREKQLRSQVYQSKARTSEAEAMRGFLGDLGIVILKDPTKVELLKVQKSSVPPGYSVTPTGRVFGNEWHQRLAGILLDNNLYMSANFDDLPDPEVGLRFWRGEDSIELLFSLESSGHLDAWSLVKPETGGPNLAHSTSWQCFSDAELEKLVVEIKAY